MKTEEISKTAKQFFMSKFLNCVPSLKSEEDVFQHIYDEISLDGVKKTICMYEEHIINKTLHINNEIWSILKDDFGHNDKEITALISIWMNDIYKPDVIFNKEF